MKIFLKGYFNANNIGDDAILEDMVSSINKEIPNPIIYFTSINRKVPSKINLNNAQGVYIKYNPILLVRTLFNSDILVIGGGGLFPKDSPFHFFKTLLFIIIARCLLVKKIIFYAIGIENLSKPISLIIFKFICNKLIDFIFVRDKHTLDLLKKANIHKIDISTDPGYFLQKDDMGADLLLKEKRIERHYISVIVIGAYFFEKEKRMKYIEGINKIIDYLIEEFPNNDIVIIPFKYPEDLLISYFIRNKNKNPEKLQIINVKNRPRIAKALISNADIVFAMRYHSLLFSISEKRPVLTIYYSHKMKEVIRLANINNISEEIGLRKNEFLQVEKTPNYEDFIKKIQYLKGNMPKVLKDIEKARNLFESNYRPLGLLIKDILSYKSKKY